MVVHALKRFLVSSARREPVTTLVLHATDGPTMDGAVTWLRLPRINLSYHFIIDEHGEVWKCVPYRDRVAWHAGRSVGPGGRSGVNAYSVGIAFVCWDSHGGLISGKQLSAALELIRVLSKDIETCKYVTTHYAISPGRKTDPATLSRGQKDSIRSLCAELGLEAWGI